MNHFTASIADIMTSPNWCYCASTPTNGPQCESDKTAQLVLSTANFVIELTAAVKCQN